MQNLDIKKIAIITLGLLLILTFLRMADILRIPKVIKDWVSSGKGFIKTTGGAGISKVKTITTTAWNTKAGCDYKKLIKYYWG